MGRFYRFLGKTARAEQKTTPKKAHSNDIVKRGKIGEPLGKHGKDLEEAVKRWWCVLGVRYQEATITSKSKVYAAQTGIIKGSLHSQI